MTQLPFMDGLKNIMAKIGLAGDKRSASGFDFNNHTIVEYSQMYRSSWIAKRGINVPAYDAVRAWRSWVADAAIIRKLDQAEKKLQIRRHVHLALIYARLYGGSAIYIGTEHNSEVPLWNIDPTPETIKFLNVISLESIHAGRGELQLDPTQPKYLEHTMYNIGSSRYGLDVHPSRLIIFSGSNYDSNIAHQSDFFALGESILKEKWEIIRDAESAIANLSALTFEAAIDVFGIPGLLERAGDPDFEEKIIKRFSIGTQSKSVNRAIIRDKNEDYEKKQITFMGVATAVEQIVKFAAGSFGIPYVRFVGDQVKGLSNSQQGDKDNYFEMVNGIQTLNIDFGMEEFNKFFVQAYAQRDDVEHVWRPMHQPSKKELIESGKIVVDMAEKLVQSQFYAPDKLAKVIAAQLDELEILPGITDVEISEYDPELTFGSESEGDGNESQVE